ncbi:MAG TPA: hypothetical protein VMU22_00120 [Rhizomicrobium sp.]|nr:hypothetical protein [Rhizomicrobium sp.]
MTLSTKLQQLRTYARRDGAGVGASLLLHVLALLIILFLAHRTLHRQPSYQPFVPVAIVAQSEGPSPEPKQTKAAGEISKTPIILPRAPVVHHTPTGVAPNKATEPVDPLEMKLKELSKLKQPNTDTRVMGEAGTSQYAENGNEDEAGGRGLYETRDIIRAQVLRRWSLDRSRLGNRNFDILIHVLLKRDGTVLEADIVDAKRFKTDSVYRWIALSAKNAVILSSPLTLPPNMDRNDLELTLRLNPRDSMQ